MAGRVRRLEGKASLVSGGEKELAGRIRRGDPGAFDAFFDRYAPRLVGYLARMVGDEAAAEDLFQETMIRVYRNIGGYREKGAFRSWVYRIATNAALSEIRHRRLAPQTVEPAILHSVKAEGPSPLDEVEKKERLERLRSGIGALPEEHRAVLLLRVQGEMDIRDIARTLGIPEGTVKSRMHHAVRKLRHYMEVPSALPEEERRHG